MITQHAINPDICQRLIEARIKQGFRSARAFALAHKIPVNTYLNHEHGTRTMRLTVLQNYSKLLHISYLWLLTGQGLQESNDPTYTANNPKLRLAEKAQRAWQGDD